MKNNKPIKDWTLAECEEYCGENSTIEILDVGNSEAEFCLHEKCPLEMCGLCLGGRLLHLRLPKLTEAEKNIMRSFGAKFVAKDRAPLSPFSISLWHERPKLTERGDYIIQGDSFCIAATMPECFPSLADGDCVELTDN